MDSVLACRLDGQGLNPMVVNSLLSEAVFVCDRKISMDFVKPVLFGSQILMVGAIPYKTWDPLVLGAMEILVRLKEH